MSSQDPSSMTKGYIPYLTSVFGILIASFILKAILNYFQNPIRKLFLPTQPHDGISALVEDLKEGNAKLESALHIFEANLALRARVEELQKLQQLAERGLLDDAELDDLRMKARAIQKDWEAVNGVMKMDDNTALPRLHD